MRLKVKLWRLKDVCEISSRSEDFEMVVVVCRCEVDWLLWWVGEYWQMVVADEEK